MSKIETSEVSLYYEQEGSGSPLILLAGYTSDISAWAFVRQKLAKYFTIFMIDNRGAGRSDSPDYPYKIENMADDVIAFIESLKIEKPALLGHSMGGAIAQAAAFKRPDVFSKLILSNTLIQLSKTSAYALSYFLKMRSENLIYEGFRLEGMLPWLFSSSFFKHPQHIPYLIQAAMNYPYSPTLTGQARQLEALLQFDSSPWFRQITTPTLVIEGLEDRMCPLDSKKLALGISRSKLVTFEDQAHMPLIEVPDRFVEPIFDFLRS